MTIGERELRQEISHQMVVSGFRLCYLMAKTKEGRREVLDKMKEYYTRLIEIEKTR